MVCVLVLVFFTILFEHGKEYISKLLDKSEAVLGHLWSELTVLGFLALVTFILINTGLLTDASKVIYNGDDHHLVHLFEVIHFSLFFVLVAFLMLALWLLQAAAKTHKIFKQFDDDIVIYSQQPKKFETQDLGRSRCMDEVKKMTKEADALGNGCFCFFPNWFWQDVNPWSVRNEVQIAAQKCVFQLFRQRFLLEHFGPRKIILPIDFEFSTYILGNINFFFEEVMELGTKTWVKIAFGMFVVFEVAAFVPHYIDDYVLIVLGWFMALLGIFYQHEFAFIMLELTPMLDNLCEEDRKFRDSLFPKGFTRSLYNFISPYARGLFGRPALPDVQKCENASRRRISATDGQPLQSPRSNYAKDDTDGRKASMKFKVAEEDREYINPGTFRLRKASQPVKRSFSFNDPLKKRSHANFFVDSPQSALFLFVSKAKAHHGKGHGQDPTAALKHSVMNPMVAIVQLMLLVSALFLTILIMYRSPESFWDAKIALAVGPVLFSLLVTVPEMIGPMVLTLSVEEFRDHKMAIEVSNKAQMKKFAQAARLLTAMRSKVTLEESKKKKEVKDSKKQSLQRAPSGLAEPSTTTKRGDETTEQWANRYITTSDKKSELLDLKASFDKFSKGDGELDKEELGALLLSTGAGKSVEEVEALMRELDEDESGTINFVEFAEKMLSEEEEISPEKVAEEIFKIMDEDGSGDLTITEIRNALTKLNINLSDSEIQYIIGTLDDDDSGNVSKDEFVEAMKKILEDAVP
jgi:Ca2+-binding EF-hand superfamily protein